MWTFKNFFAPREINFSDIFPVSKTLILTVKCYKFQSFNIFQKKGISKCEHHPHIVAYYLFNEERKGILI